MADLLDKKPASETKAPAAPQKQRLDLRPRLEKPPAPRINRWIQWMALFVVAVTAAVLAAVLLGGSDEDVVTVPAGQEAEHGQYTQAVLVARPAAALPGFVGTNPPDLDPDRVAPEHGDFTGAVLVDRTGATTQGFVGTNTPDLDPDGG